MAERGERFGDQLTPGNYCCDKVASALQKAIRRGEEREALFWASELDLAGFGNYVWKRLLVIASEDVGSDYGAADCPCCQQRVYRWRKQRRRREREAAAA